MRLRQEFDRAAAAISPTDPRTVDALWDVKTRLEAATGLTGDQLLAESVSRRRIASRAAAKPVYCTKHVYSGRRLVNLYGGIHRTPGPECDGPEHRRTAWWW